MNSVDLPFLGQTLTALPSGALYWDAERVLVVSDLHLGKSERIARLGGALLPPYDTVETLSRLSADVAATEAKTVICLGDSFDDLAASQALGEAERDTIARLASDAERLDAMAAAAGWRLVGGTTLFRTYDTGDAAAVQDRLARESIWTRIFPYSESWVRFGLPGTSDGWGRLRAALGGVGLP